MSTQATTGYLENQFLIAMPQLTDSYFAHTVTYLWKHNEEGALGIIINKPLQACAIVGELADTIEHEVHDPAHGNLTDMSSGNCD